MIVTTIDQTFSVLFSYVFFPLTKEKTAFWTYKTSSINRQCWGVINVFYPRLPQLDFPRLSICVQSYFTLRAGYKKLNAIYLSNLMWQVNIFTHCSLVIQCTPSACRMFSIGQACRICYGLQTWQLTLPGNCSSAVTCQKNK